MHTFLTILLVFIAIFIVLVVMVQNSKGGGLAAGFSSANQVMGVRKTTDLLEKITWWSAAALVGVCILTTVLTHPKVSGGAEELMIKADDKALEQDDVNSLPPAFDGTVPEEGTQETTPATPAESKPEN